MIKRTIFSTVLLLAAFAGSASATVDFGTAPPPPKKNTLDKSNQIGLYEKEAFSLYEAAMQLAEGAVVEKGCPTKPVVIPFDIFVDQNGGNMHIAGTTLGSTIQADIATRGTILNLSQQGDANILDNPITGFNSKARFSEFGDIQTVFSSFTVGKDNFNGWVIKDFYLNPDYVFQDQVITAIQDYGIQVVAKIGFPVNKYWQQSVSWHWDGIDGQTHFKKTRVTGGIPCLIKVNGRTDIAGPIGDFFSEKGSLIIKRP